MQWLQQFSHHHGDLRGPSVFFDTYMGFCPLPSVHNSTPTRAYHASPSVFIPGAPTSPRNCEGWPQSRAASCFPSCSDDVLHPWQLSDAPHVHQSKCITSFDCVLLWQSAWRRRMAPPGPSVFVEWLALLETASWWEGQTRHVSLMPWSPQTHISRRPLWGALICMQHVPSLVIGKNKLNQPFNSLFV